jgi:hypothetical protein
VGTYTTQGLYKPTVGESGWGALVDANWDLLDPLLDPLALSRIATMPPTVLTSLRTITVGTSSVNLSSITGGIPTGATHALLSVPAVGQGGNPNSATGVWFTEDGSTTPVPSTGVGLFIAAGLEDEITNLANVKLIADAAGLLVYPSFRHY